MDEDRAAAYYEEQKAKGAGAAQFKRGLGYKPPNQEAPAAEHPPQPAPNLTYPWTQQSYSQAPPHAPFFSPQPLTPYPTYHPLPGVVNRPYGGMQSSQKPGSPWTAHRSGQLVYYYNSVTGVSQWERPMDFVGPVVAPAETPKPVASERVVNTTWTEVKCEDGRTYYYNLLNKETVWNVPEEVKRARDPDSVITVQPPPVTVTVQPRSEEVTEVKRGRKATVEKRDAFLALLSDSGVTAYSRFEKEASKLGSDPRWLGVSLEKERRSLFDVFCRGHAPDSSNTKQPSSDSHFLRNAFEQLLKEFYKSDKSKDESHSDKIKSEAVDGDALRRLEEECKDDPRWKACPPQTRQELIDAFRRTLPSPRSNSQPKTDPVPAKRSRSRSTSPDQSPSESKKHDPREGSEKEKQKRARVEREMRESERRLKRASHSSAVSDYRILLSELVRQPDISWNAVRDRILADLQGRGNHPSMTDREREELFYDHIDRLQRNAVQDYQRRLSETLGAQLSANEEKPDLRMAWESFEAAEKLLEIDPRSLQPSQDTKRKLWKRHVEGK